MREANFEIVEETDDVVLIRDIGPWEFYPTVTNDARRVVVKLADRLRGRRLEYYDSDGKRDQLLVRDGGFVGFAPSGPRGNEGD